MALPSQWLIGHTGGRDGRQVVIIIASDRCVASLNRFGVVKVNAVGGRKRAVECGKRVLVDLSGRIQVATIVDRRGSEARVT